MTPAAAPDLLLHDLTRLVNEIRTLIDQPLAGAWNASGGRGDVRRPLAHVQGALLRAEVKAKAALAQALIQHPTETRRNS